MNLNIVDYQLIPKGGDCPLDDTAFLSNMAESLRILCEKEEGIGLSAVQTGLPYNFFVVNFDGKYRYFANCVYNPIDDTKEKSVEGCLSLKDANGNFEHYAVERYSNIRVTGKEYILDLGIQEISEIPVDVFRFVFQHEIDHAFGILIKDIGRRVYVRKGK